MEKKEFVETEKKTNNTAKTISREISVLEKILLFG